MVIFLSLNHHNLCGEPLPLQLRHCCSSLPSKALTHSGRGDHLVWTPPPPNTSKYDNDLIEETKKKILLWLLMQLLSMRGDDRQPETQRPEASSLRSAAVLPCPSPTRSPDVTMRGSISIQMSLFFKDPPSHAG